MNTAERLIRIPDRLLTTEEITESGLIDLSLVQVNHPTLQEKSNCPGGYIYKKLFWVGMTWKRQNGFTSRDRSPLDPPVGVILEDIPLLPEKYKMAEALEILSTIIWHYRGCGEWLFQCQKIRMSHPSSLGWGLGLTVKEEGGIGLFFLRDKDKTAGIVIKIGGL